MRISRNIGLFLLSLLLPAWPQEERNDEVLENMSKIVVTLELDRAVYFPGEFGDLTITVRNPTSTVLQIRRPFVSETGTIVLSEKRNGHAPADGSEYFPVSPPPYTIADPSVANGSPLPQLQLGAGEQIRKTFHFYDRALGNTSENYLVFAGSAPSWAGQFRLKYWGKAVDFDVVRPIWEGMVAIDLPETQEIKALDSAPGSIHLRTYAFVLEYERKHFICLARVPFPQEPVPPDTDAHGSVIDRTIPFRRYSRVAESDELVQDLRGESDLSGSITLTWGKDGEHRLYLDRTEWQVPGLKFGQ